MTVREIAVPARLKARSTLPRIDYADAFEVETDGPATAEGWARAALEGAPWEMRRSLEWGWFALGLRLGPADAPDRILGWELRRSTPEVALLGADSRVGMPAEVLFERRGRSLFLATFVRHGNPLTRLFWKPFSVQHRQVVRHLLGQAAARRGACRSGRSPTRGRR